MASMTDYMVLHDGAFELDTKPGAQPFDEKPLVFDLPPDFTVGTRFAKPLLAFLANPRADKVRMTFFVNPQFPLLQSAQEGELSWTKAPKLDQALWQPIDGRKFKKGDQNTIVFKVREGHVRLRAVILWFQRGSGA